MLVYLMLIEDEGEKCKFKALYSKYERLMFHVARRILRNETDTEDAVQEAFFEVAKNISKISDVNANKTRSYLIIIVRNEALKIYNAQKKQEKVTADTDFYGIADSYPRLSPLSAAISRMPDDYKELILLKYDNGFTSREIAQMLGTTDGAVRQKLLKAREQLRAELKKEGMGK